MQRIKFFISRNLKVSQILKSYWKKNSCKKNRQGKIKWITKNTDFAICKTNTVIHYYI